MKIYTQDLGVWGCIVVVAPTMNEAVSMMENCLNYEKNHARYPITEHDVVPGVILNNLGDT